MTQVYHTNETPEKKLCKACGEMKFLHEMVQRKGRGDGTENKCKQCQNALQRAYLASKKGTPPTEGTKVCTTCKTEKPVTEFFPIKKGSTLLRPVCKECSNGAGAQWREENSDYIHEKWRQDRYERYNAQTPEGEAYRQVIRNGRDKWNANHKQERNEHTLRYIARRYEATIEPVDLKAILERDGLICSLCGGTIDPSLPGNTPQGLSFDHIIPLSKGGPHAMHNMHPAHQSCNARKRDRLLP